MGNYNSPQIPLFYMGNNGKSISRSISPGFMDGWYMDEKCLARQTQIKGSSLPLEGIKHFHDIPEAIDAVKAGTVSQGYRLEGKGQIKLTSARGNQAFPRHP